MNTVTRGIAGTCISVSTARIAFGNRTNTASGIAGTRAPSAPCGCSPNPRPFCSKPRGGGLRDEESYCGFNCWRFFFKKITIFGVECSRIYCLANNIARCKKFNLNEINLGFFLQRLEIHSVAGILISVGHCHVI